MKCQVYQSAINAYESEIVDNEISKIHIIMPDTEIHGKYELFKVMLFQK